MSRIGKLPVVIPAGVEATVEGNTVTVKGPKGTLTQSFHPDMTIRREGNVIHVERSSDEKLQKSLHGLTRTLIQNMVIGVTKGYSKELEVNGVGFRVQKQGKKVVMQLGFSHPVEVEEVPGITLSVNANKIVVSGPDKQQVGHFAAEVRRKKPPEPYKGKGIKYADEVIRRKEGKAGKGAKSAAK